MKNLILIMLVVAATSFSACGQKKAPEAVKKAFIQKFPTTTAVTWDQENKNEWEAEFKMDGKSMSANFDNNGKWLETEITLSKSDLPASIKKTLESEFPAYKIKDLSSVETIDLNAYELDLSKGHEKLEILIDANGKILKKQILKNGEDEEDKD